MRRRASEFVQRRENVSPGKKSSYFSVAAIEVPVALQSHGAAVERDFIGRASGGVGHNFGSPVVAGVAPIHLGHKEGAVDTILIADRYAQKRIDQRSR